MLKELWKLIKMLFSSTPKDSPKTTILRMKHFPFNGYSAMMWCGTIIMREDYNKKIKVSTITHEGIHIQQASRYKKWYQYYLRYVLEWIKGNPITHPSQGAYYTIPFEMEAYANENNKQYIATKESLNKYIIKDRKSTYKKYRDNWKNYLKTL